MFLHRHVVKRIMQTSVKRSTAIFLQMLYLECWISPRCHSDLETNPLFLPFLSKLMDLWNKLPTKAVNGVDWLLQKRNKKKQTTKTARIWFLVLEIGTDRDGQMLHGTLASVLLRSWKFQLWWTTCQVWLTVDRVCGGLCILGWGGEETLQNFPSGHWIYMVELLRGRVVHGHWKEQACWTESSLSLSLYALC